MEAVVLARIQFALFITFHYLFVPLSLGLGLMLVVMGGLFLKTKKKIYRQLSWFWINIFSLIFVIGVVTGLLMIFSFGANWAYFSEYVGNIFGALLGSEAVFAFFLESTFLGILIFGKHKVSPKMHFFATCMVAIGAHMSAFWIICANSWMQTPDGHSFVQNQGVSIPIIVNLWKVIFTPSTIHRLLHTVIGAWLSGIFLVISVSSYYLKKQRHIEFAIKGLKLGAIVGFIALFLQLGAADVSARGVARYQPIKLAAFEGVFETKEKTPIWLFGYVDKANKKVRGVKIPSGLSFLVHRNLRTPVKGLDQVDPKLWPQIQVVFQLYHLMVMFWGVMLLLVLVSFGASRGYKIFRHPLILSCLSLSVLVPQLCNEVGWYCAEMGRQPWVVQGLLKTKDAISPLVNKSQIMQSIVLFSCIFVILLALFIFLLCQKIKQGPNEMDLIEDINL